MDVFFKRKSEYGGLNLSQRVWKYVGDFKTEMEMALSVAMGEGKSAATISREVRKYLQRPDMMFRRFRVKTGEQDIFDANGNVVGKEPVYGRVWKRKVVDAVTGNVSWQTVNLKDYSFGRGVYRSSYKNAMRLARTETNMAYRTAIKSDGDNLISSLVIVLCCLTIIQSQIFAMICRQNVVRKAVEVCTLKTLCLKVGIRNAVAMSCRYLQMKKSLTKYRRLSLTMSLYPKVRA